MTRIAHIINPVFVKESSSLHLAQVVTFETMLRAKNNGKGHDSVSLYAIGYEEDNAMVPDHFLRLPSLQRSVLDLGKFGQPKKLPLIADILAPLRDLPGIDYVIYTNVDIALMPFFYDFVEHKIQTGADSFIINRRVIKDYSDLNIYNLFSIAGTLHPGYDCFVFRQETLKKCDFKNACIGANWIGRAMYINLLAHSEKLEVLKESHLTFHLGEDLEWMSEKFLDFDLHNKNEVKKIIADLKQRKFPAHAEAEMDRILVHMDKFYADRKKKSEPVIEKTSFLKRVFNRLRS